MATSNSYTYTIDRDTLIRTAYENIGIAVEGEPLDADYITVAARALNMLIKSWVVHGLQVWKRKTSTIPLVAGNQWYDIGQHETNSVTLTGTGAVATATLPYHGYSTGASVTIAGATDTNYNGTVTITVTSPSTFTYTSTGSGADSGTCTLQGGTDVPRPERILYVDLVDSSGNKTELSPITRTEYEELPNHTSSGTPNQYHYERRLGAGRLYVWPVADSTTATDYTLRVVYQAQIEDAGDSTDTLDFPAEWLDAISLGLSNRLAGKYGYPLQARYLLKKDATEALEAVINYDVEDGSMYIQVDTQGSAK